MKNVIIRGDQMMITSPNWTLMKFMHDKGIRQRHLAAITKLSPATMSLIVKKGHLPDVIAGQIIARELGTTVDVLWPLPEEMKYE